MSSLVTLFVKPVIFLQFTKGNKQRGNNKTKHLRSAPAVRNSLPRRPDFILVLSTVFALAFSSLQFNPILHARFYRVVGLWKEVAF